MRTADRLLARADDINAQRRARWAACPLELREAIVYQAMPIAILTAWVRKGLAAGECMRTAQSERIARGESLQAVAYATGLSVEAVMDILTWAELPDDV